jgi:hypothetical protein
MTVAPVTRQGIFDRNTPIDWNRGVSCTPLLRTDSAYDSTAAPFFRSSRVARASIEGLERLEKILATLSHRSEVLR